jgi:hypothetical protein
MVNATTDAKFILEVFEKLAPTLNEMYFKNFRKCPVNGTFDVVMNYTSEITDQLLIPPGEYKHHFRWYDEKNRTIYLLKLYTIRQDKQRQS